MKIIIDDDWLSNELKQLINTDILLNDNFPFYFYSSSIKDGKSDAFLSHVILRRPEERDWKDQWNSSYKETLIFIFSEFCKKHKIVNPDMLRCSVNFTYPNGHTKMETHEDHPYPHKQLIVYLNNPLDKKSCTVLMDKKEKKITNKIEPKQWRGVCFDSVPHYQFYPTKGHRIIIIYTFK